MFDAALLAAVGADVTGREDESETVVATLDAGRHLVLEGPPGTGKSTLLRSLAHQAGVAVHIERVDVRDFMGTDPPGHVLTNPPYGVRLARGETFDRDLSRAFRELRGHRVSAICLDGGLRDAMGMKPAQEHALWNGDLECRLFSWEP